MLGCEREATALASRSNRVSAAGSSAMGAGNTLMAASRSRRVSPGAIDFTHPARAEGRDDLIGTKVTVRRKRDQELLSPAD